VAELLGCAKDFASATQAYEWLISQADRMGWTAYGRMLKAGLKACGEGRPFICDIYPAGVAFPEEFRYTNVRRLPSFQGPEIRRRRLLPLHLWDPKDLSGGY
jgi:hypothetical protein